MTTIRLRLSSVAYFHPLLQEPFLRFAVVPLLPHYLFGCHSPERPHSNQREMREDKANSASPLAPKSSQADGAEMTGLCLVAS